MNRIIQKLSFAFLLVALASSAFVSTASAQTSNEQIENQIAVLEQTVADLDSRADGLEERADRIRNQTRAARLDARATAIRERIVRIEARIANLEAPITPDPEPTPDPDPAPGEIVILQISDLNLSDDAQRALTIRSAEIASPTRQINSISSSVSTDSNNLFSLADDGRIIDQNGQVVTPAQFADGIVGGFRRILRSADRLGIDVAAVAEEFRPLAESATNNLLITLGA